MSQEHALLVATMDFYASRILDFIKDGTASHRSLIAVMMESGLTAGPTEADAILNLLVAAKKLHKAESSLGTHASELYLPY